MNPTHPRLGRFGLILVATIAAGLAYVVPPVPVRADDGPATRPLIVPDRSTTGPTTAPVAPAGTYRNPLGVDVADPHVLLHDGTYYLYGTSARDGYRVWSSADLVNWQPRGRALRRTDDTWGRNLFWAPCVIHHDGAFYMFYSSRGPVKGEGGSERESHRICLARSDSPTGPFTDVKAPLLDFGKAVIDAHVFIDDRDGAKPYLYYARDISENGQSQIWVVPLSADLLAPAGEPVLCTRPDVEWEGDQWNEAPFVFRHGDTYVMTYSARGFFDPRYGIGYATAPSPLGPWTKSPDNPILQRNGEVSGPGHNSVVVSPDGTELFAVYHVHKRLEGGHARELSIDRLIVEDAPDGQVRLRIAGPSRTPQPLPSGASHR